MNPDTAPFSTRVIASETALREIYAPPPDLIRRKQLSRLDQHCRRFIALSPLLCISTAARDGSCDVSPRGDAPGFVKIIDDGHLAIPDRPGNNRLDALRNIIANPHVGLLFIIPGINDVLRVNGGARVIADPQLLEEMSVNGRAPATAILVAVDEAYLHCGRAFMRSHIWDPSRFQPADAMPPLAQILAEQTSPDADERALLVESATAPLY